MADKYPSVEPGELRHYVQVQNLSSSQDASGQQTSTPRTVLSAYAAIDEAQGVEKFQSGQFTAQNTHVVKMRWSAVNIVPGMQVQHGRQVYKIQHTINVQRRNILTKLMCLAIDEGTNPQ